MGMGNYFRRSFLFIGTQPINSSGRRDGVKMKENTEFCLVRSFHQSGSSGFVVYDPEAEFKLFCEQSFRAS